MSIQIITQTSDICKPPVAGPREGPQGQASLGSHTAKSVPDTQNERKTARYHTQDTAQKLLPDKNEETGGPMFQVVNCARWPVPHERIELHYDGGQAFYSGLAVCGSVWVCPVCAARISGERREELRAALRIAEHAGWGYALATFTLRHTPADKLTELNDALNTAYRKTKGGRAWSAFVERWGVIGTVTAYEVTRGVNGWHPHKHVLIFFAHPLTDNELTQVRDWLAERFCEQLARLGRYASGIYSVDVRSTPAAVDYVTKWGLDSELTGGEAKSEHGYTPFQLLTLYDNGATWAGAAFREYAFATKGLVQMRWSKGLKRALAAALGVGSVDRDVDLLALVAEHLPVPVPEVVPEFPTWELELTYEWPFVVKASARGELLTVASSGDLGAVRCFLESIVDYSLDRLKAAKARAALAAKMEEQRERRAARPIRVAGLRVWGVIGDGGEHIAA